MKKIKALSFFTGAMGLDIGLKKAGIDVILACESEKFIRETIKLNKPKLKVLEDINLYTPEQIKKAAGLKKNEKVEKTSNVAGNVAIISGHVAGHERGRWATFVNCPQQCCWSRFRPR